MRGKMQVDLRAASREDAERIAEIYAYHVQNGLASFEETPPDVSEIEARFAKIAEQGLPYLCAEAHGRVVGYAYAAPYRTRSAYRYTLEDSVYIDADLTGRGVGKLLLAELIARCEAQGFRRMIAVIGDSGNRRSISLHESLGFSHAGLLPAAGFKFGRWVDSVLMQRALGRGDTSSPDW